MYPTCIQIPLSFIIPSLKCYVHIVHIVNYILNAIDFIRAAISHLYHIRSGLARFPSCLLFFDDVIKWKHFPRYWQFVRGIHRSPVNSPHKGQWRWALMFSLKCALINGWVNNREAGDLRRHRAHYDVTVMQRMDTTLSIVSIGPMIKKM